MSRPIRCPGCGVQEGEVSDNDEVVFHTREDYSGRTVYTCSECEYEFYIDELNEFTATRVGR